MVVQTCAEPILLYMSDTCMFSQGLQRWVTSIGSLTRNLKKTTARLNEHLKFNKTSLREAIGDLISQAEFAQQYLRVNGSREVTEVNYTSPFIFELVSDAVRPKFMLFHSIMIYDFFIYTYL